MQWIMKRKCSQTVNFAIDLSVPVTRINVANYTSKDGKVILSKCRIYPYSHDSLRVKEIHLHAKEEKFTLYKTATVSETSGW